MVTTFTGKGVPGGRKSGEEEEDIGTLESNRSRRGNQRANVTRRRQTYNAAVTSERGQFKGGDEHDVGIYNNTISKLSRAQLGPCVARRRLPLHACPLPFSQVTLHTPHARNVRFSLLSLFRSIVTSTPDLQQHSKRNMDPGLGADEVSRLSISL